MHAAVAQQERTVAADLTDRFFFSHSRIAAARRSVPDVFLLDPDDFPIPLLFDVYDDDFPSRNEYGVMMTNECESVIVEHRFLMHV